MNNPTINLLTDIRRELKEGSDEKTAAQSQYYFKDEVKVYGIKMPAVGKIARSYFREIKNLSKHEIFDLCEELWRSGYIEESVIACEWTYALKKEFEPEDFTLFERWIDRYVNNWASCDTLCNHTVGTLVEKYPEKIAELKRFARSGNRWMRRAAAVTLIIPARKGLFTSDIFDIADILLMDNEDLVQKGYGWMLKAASQANQKAVFDYVIKNKKVMPRTALRYAIEKMPAELKKEAMKKD